MIAKPGDQFFYGGIGINIAGLVLEVISGKGFETIFQERLAKPLGMNQTTFVNNHAVNPSGGVMSSASDYMKFLVMILNKGTAVDGKKILKKESVELMEKSWTADVKIVTAPEEALNYEYGLGQWILETDEIDNSSVVSSPGLFGTFPYVEIDKGYAAILFVKTMQFKNRDQIYKAVKAAVDTGLEE